MIGHNDYRDHSPKLALAISICFHVLVLLSAHYTSLKQWIGTPSRSGYSITFNPTQNHQKKILENIAHNSLPTSQSISKTVPPIIKNKQEENQIPSRETEEKKPINTVTETQTDTEKAQAAKQIENSVQEISKPSETIHQEAKTSEIIDERGLYKVYQGKQTGALLELAGWMWDTAPQPQDNTDESGKIVFQITIDELGEVIAVKTLEKTISPPVEKIYKEALTRLTFSKTADSVVYAPTFTGKITFILQLK